MSNITWILCIVLAISAMSSGERLVQIGKIVTGSDLLLRGATEAGKGVVKEGTFPLEPSTERIAAIIIRLQPGSENTQIKIIDGRLGKSQVSLRFTPVPGERVNAIVELWSKA